MFYLFFVLIIFIKDLAACISLGYLGRKENRKKAMQPGLLNKGIPQLTWLVVSRKYQLQESGGCSSFSFPFLASAFLWGWLHPQALSKAAAVQALIFIHSSTWGMGLPEGLRKRRMDIPAALHKHLLESHCLELSHMRGHSVLITVVL